MSSLNPALSASHPSAFRARATDEFAVGASGWPGEIDRREFLKVMGASLMLAGISGCARRLPDQLVSRADAPGSPAIPELAWYATAVPWHGYARGALVRVARGRPTLLEGNPDHPESRGALDAVSQASILSLYDPERSSTPQRAGRTSSWDAFSADWRKQREELEKSRGAGVALLTAPTTSPTSLAEIGALLKQWPEAAWYQYSAMPDYERGGGVDFDFSRTRTILTVGSDTFFEHPASLRRVREFTRRRGVGRHPGARLFALEATPTLTGMRADLRLAAPPHRFGPVLAAIAHAVDRRPGDVTGLSVRETEFVQAVFQALQMEAPAICVAGETESESVQAWSRTFNARFGGDAMRTRSTTRSDHDPRCRGGVDALLADLRSGRIREAIITGCNPVYSSASGAELAKALRELGTGIHLGMYVDETAAGCAWHLPEAHFLESWSDLRCFSGEATVMQPVTEPLGNGRSMAEVIRFLATGEWTNSYDLVRKTWSAGGDESSERNWANSLRRGVVDEVPSAPPVPASAVAWPTWVEAEAPGFTAFFRPDPNLHDGATANNAWLQELPRPFTALTWENAVLVSPADGRAMGIETGDVVRCEVDGVSLEGAAWLLPGQAERCLTLHLGHGRSTSGRVGQGRGFSVQALRPSASPWERRGVSLQRTGRRQTLASTQRHFQTEGREPVRSVDPGGKVRREDARATLLEAWPSVGHAWGMSIDLETCFGCSACVVACQAENNIPVVGREQVLLEREMHWIRIDRYYVGEAEDSRVLHQPVPCMQCENAPCELVCPVGATVHSSEGLNDMVYNRCVGTRYCANNCPYKVRRFNFLDFRPPSGSSEYLRTNPRVSIRERGVMEKCTYCVQRIDAGRIVAERERRPLRDGEIRTACQQACPVGAIVFGDLADLASAVSVRRRDDRNYAFLEELGTRPRTTYLARIERRGAGKARS
ncbi:MAG TPA: 4Fe-4S dicluster domain-containing protein [Candidatus Didemnitutus sp.]|nr:4Fe-4S dicluster domain-containing protein [Candidatus Didemnitutus sp.]